MKKSKYLLAMLLCCMLTSCDPYFWMGMMAGMMSMPTTYDTYNVYPSYSSTYVPTYDYSGASSTPTSTNTSSGSSSSSGSSIQPRTCKKLSATDLAHCNGSGICSKCNGNKKYYDNSFGQARWVDPCVICNGSGKCPTCFGKGTHY